MAERVEEATCPLRDEAASIKLWLARATACLEHAEVVSQAPPTSRPLAELNVFFTDERDAELYG